MDSPSLMLELTYKFFNFYFLHVKYPSHKIKYMCLKSPVYSLYKSLINFNIQRT